MVDCLFKLFYFVRWIGFYEKELFWWKLFYSWFGVVWSDVSVGGSILPSSLYGWSHWWEDSEWRDCSLWPSTIRRDSELTWPDETGTASWWPILMCLCGCEMGVPVWGQDRMCEPFERVLSSCFLKNSFWWFRQVSDFYLIDWLLCVILGFWGEYCAC